MLCILITKWQSHPKFKSGQNLISEIYPEREKKKQKRKDWEDEETKIKRQVGGGGAFVSTSTDHSRGENVKVFQLLPPWFALPARLGDKNARTDPHVHNVMSLPYFYFYKAQNFVIVLSSLFLGMQAKIVQELIVTDESASPKETRVEQLYIAVLPIVIAVFNEGMEKKWEISASMHSTAGILLHLFLWMLQLALGYAQKIDTPSAQYDKLYGLDSRDSKDSENFSKSEIETSPMARPINYLESNDKINAGDADSRLSRECSTSQLCNWKQNTVTWLFGFCTQIWILPLLWEDTLDSKLVCTAAVPLCADINRPFVVWASVNPRTPVKAKGSFVEYQARLATRVGDKLSHDPGPIKALIRLNAKIFKLGPVRALIEISFKYLLFSDLKKDRGKQTHEASRRTSDQLKGQEEQLAVTTFSVAVLSPELIPRITAPPANSLPSYVYIVILDKNHLILLGFFVLWLAQLATPIHSPSIIL
ncbi:hypothetical protein Q9966_009227 [Columba livia]|nr:hypothetical protein Q9966_009227 [Columba livia]